MNILFHDVSLTNIFSRLLLGIVTPLVHTLLLSGRLLSAILCRQRGGKVG